MKRLILLLLFFPAATGLAQTPRPVKLPSIIYLMVDDMGYADIGPYGQTEIKTPNIDRMAQEGMRFTAAYTGASVCAPSRSVLMTGQHLGHTRVRGNTGNAGGVLDHNNARRIPLEPEDVTVAQVLKARGYITAMTGKWGLGEAGSTGEPVLKGWDEWFGFLNQNHAHTHYPDYLWRNQQKVPIPANEGGKRQQHSHELFTNFAFDFIRRRSQQPFFLYLSYTLPHQEDAVPAIAPAYAGKSWSEADKIYATMIDMIDRDVGRLYGLLKELGIDDSTIVFFTSDNGGPRRHDGLFESNRGLRGAKGDLYEGGMRTPMIVRWPGRTPAGATSELPMYFADVLPTLADLAGATPPPYIDGMSVLPSILGQRQVTDRMLYWEQYAGGGGGFQQAARWGKWKGIRFEGKPFELYDLGADPEEKTNVAASHATVVAKIAAFLDSSHVPSPNWTKRPMPAAGAPKKEKKKK
jgi:arylsulfatase A-like enzyme